MVQFCTTIGWRWAFYFHAALTAAVFLLWVLFYHDDPQYHRVSLNRDQRGTREPKTEISEKQVHERSSVIVCCVKRIMKTSLQTVSAKELGKIHHGKTKEHIERDSFVPYKV